MTDYHNNNCYIKIVLQNLETHSTKMTKGKSQSIAEERNVLTNYNNYLRDKLERENS